MDEQSQDDFVNERVLVVPGEELGDDGSFKAGMGTYRHAGKIFSSHLGIKSVRAGYVNVVPLSGKYLPRPGDSVIGVVSDMGPSSWFIDLNSPYPGMLHVNEAPWKVDYGDTARYLRLGDAILAKVLSVDDTKRVQITMKEHGLRKLGGGELMRIPHSKVPRVIGKGGSMISLLKQYTQCRMFVGQNGNIWIDGELEGIILATKAIDMIDRKAQVVGLTEEVRVFLAENASAGIVEATAQGDRD